jgi:MFS family permease
VIQSHIMAMFLPSLFSGFLVGRFGPVKIIVAGLALLFACLAVAFVDRQLMHYWWSLVLLGVGWNFLFLGGTTLLTSTYRPAERFKVQALNDFIVFSMQALAALGSGFILAQFGWNWIIALSLPFLLLLLPVLFLTRGRLVLN